MFCWVKLQKKQYRCRPVLVLTKHASLSFYKLWTWFALEYSSHDKQLDTFYMVSNLRVHHRSHFSQSLRICVVGYIKISNLNTLQHFWWWSSRTDPVSLGKGKSWPCEWASRILEEITLSRDIIHCSLEKRQPDTWVMGHFGPSLWDLHAKIW